MECKICKSHQVSVIYEDYIRDGEFGSLTQKKYKMYMCADCNTIWHENRDGQNTGFYESAEYRKSVGDNETIDDFYRVHDGDVINKLNYIGTEGVRNKVIVDIGCGGGSVLDFYSGVASHCIAIEPSLIYRQAMSKKGYEVYAYAENAIERGVTADIVFSFDVIEHVDDPIEFMKNVKKLLKPDGRAIIGTPTDAPVLRKLGGHEFEKFYFRYAHPWVFSRRSYEIICKEAGFEYIEIKNIQLYGLSNLLNWIKYQRPMGSTKNEIIPDALEYIYKIIIENNDLGDSMIAYLR